MFLISFLLRFAFLLFVRFLLVVVVGFFFSYHLVGRDFAHMEVPQEVLSSLIKILIGG